MPEMRPTDLCRALDKYASQQEREALPGPTSGDHDEYRANDLAVEHSLQNAIRAYAARWIIGADSDQDHRDASHKAYIRSLWRVARGDMLKVLNRLCYRSVLTLYLFGQTPLPTDISEEERLNGISAEVCSQTALLLLQKLRDQSRALVRGFSRGNDESLRKYLDLETRAYWLGVIWDTADSMNLNIRSSLTSGLKGACCEPTWQIVHSFLNSGVLTGLASTDDGSPDVSPRIVCVANVARLYIWKNITSAKEALRECVDEDSLQQSWVSLLYAFDIWQTHLRPLLKDFDPFDTAGWFEVVTDFDFGVLSLSKVLKESRRDDLARQLTALKHDAESEALCLLNVVLDTEEFSRAADITAHLDFGPAYLSQGATSAHPEKLLALARLLKVPCEAKVSKSP